MIAPRRIPQVAVCLALVWLVLVPTATAQKATRARLIVRSTAPSVAPASGQSANVLPDEAEPNNTPEEAQLLSGASPIVINGTVDVDDEGGLIVPFSDGTEDDLEDLYQITTEADGLTITLDDLEADCDLHLIDEAAERILESSATIGDGSEMIDVPTQPAGTYFIGVTIYDLDPIQNTTSYELTVTATAAATAAEDAADVPHQFDLSPNYPNPFNPETVIPYTLTEPSAVRLEIFDVHGRLVRTLVAGRQAPNAYAVVWDGQTDAGAEAPSGAYVYRLSVGEHTQSRTLVLVR